MFDLIFAAGLCHAIDGDTLDCKGQRLRLWGIDAAERQAPGGRLATDKLNALIHRRQLECIIKGKSYERIVVKCHAVSFPAWPITAIRTEYDLACEMLRAKQAVEWLRFSHNYYASCSKGVKP